ncbi:MAG: hypothetical protein ACO1QR_10690 [Chthoniobacteraceae bacterium]
MKTTLDLPDDLLIAAKRVAAERRTTLKEMVTRSLRREIGLGLPETPTLHSAFEIGELGLPVLKRHNDPLSADEYRAMIDQIEREEDQRHFPAPAR